MKRLAILEQGARTIEVRVLRRHDIVGFYLCRAADGTLLTVHSQCLRKIKNDNKIRKSVPRPSAGGT